MKSLLIGILAVLLLSACIGQNPKDILLQSFDKMSNYPNLQVNYTASMNYQGLGTSSQNSFSQAIYKTSENARFDASDILRYYNINNSVYQCSNIFGFVCTELGNETNSNIFMNYDGKQTKERFEHLLNKSYLTISNFEESKVLDRPCYKFYFIYNVSAPEYPDIKSQYPSMTPSMFNLNKYEFSYCLDKESGYILSQDAEMRTNIMNVTITSTATSFNLNPTFDENTFKLPAQPQSAEERLQNLLNLLGNLSGSQ